MQATLCHYRRGRWTQPIPAHLDGPQTLVLAFGSLPQDECEAQIGELAKALPQSVVLGCSTAGEIVEDEIHDETLAVAVIQFASTTLRPACAPVSDAAESREAGAALGRALSGDGLRAVLVLSDGLGVNGSELVRGINGAVPPGVVVTGGLAGDGPRFERTWVWAGGAMRPSHVVGVGLTGEKLRVGHGSRGGWDMFGPERMVTRSAGNLLFELDGQPALAIYREYLGELAANLPASGLLFPLAIRQEGGAPPLVRTILGIDDATQSLRFAGDIPQGGVAQLMHANTDRLVDAAEAAVAGALSVAANEGSICISISCVGRRLVLGERADEETTAAKDALPANVPQIGFYSYGELSPVASGSCDLHNQTMTITLLAEAA